MFVSLLVFFFFFFVSKCSLFVVAVGVVSFIETLHLLPVVTDSDERKVR